MPGPSIFNQSQSVYDFNLVDPSGILPLQLAQPNAPSPVTVKSGTNLIIPDGTSQSQLINFPEEVYDLRSTSHLVRLMRALLGDSGAGQLRKRVLLTRLETALNGANFFDLDRFYGAIFGAIRQPQEQLAINPMDDVATPDEWDELMAADANFRERIIQLAKAIMMGATTIGLQAAAQAIVSVPVDIYETWALLDAYGPGYAITFNTWAEVESTYTTWSAIDNPVKNWTTIEGTVQLGNLPVPTRGELIVRPHKNYSGDTTGEESRDLNALSRVLNVLKPASTIVTISADAGEIHVPVPLAGVESDSNYWEVVQQVTPNQNLTDPDASYPLSFQQSTAGVDPTSPRILPIPPFSQGQGVEWSVNNSIRQVRSYSRSMIDVATGDVPSNWYTPPGNDDASILFPDGINITYSATQGIMPAATATAALAAMDGAIIAHPYTGDRVSVTPHT